MNSLETIKAPTSSINYIYVHPHLIIALRYDKYGAYLLPKDKKEILFTNQPGKRQPYSSGSVCV